MSLLLSLLRRRDAVRLCRVIGLCLSSHHSLRLIKLFVLTVRIRVRLHLLRAVFSESIVGLFLVVLSCLRRFLHLCLKTWNDGIVLSSSSSSSSKSCQNRRGERPRASVSFVSRLRIHPNRSTRCLYCRCFDQLSLLRRAYVHSLPNRHVPVFTQSKHVPLCL